MPTCYCVTRVNDEVVEIWTTEEKAKKSMKERGEEGTYVQAWGIQE